MERAGERERETAGKRGSAHKERERERKRKRKKERTSEEKERATYSSLFCKVYQAVSELRL